MEKILEDLNTAKELSSRSEFPKSLSKGPNIPAHFNVILSDKIKYKLGGLCRLNRSKMLDDKYQLELSRFMYDPIENEQDYCEIINKCSVTKRLLNANNEKQVIKIRLGDGI